MNIRPVTAGDFSRWLPLWDQYNAFYRRTVTLEISKLTWERFLDPAEPVFALLAEEDGKILGFTHFIFHRSTSTPHDLCYLQDLFTLEGSRGGGIGKALIEAVSAEAKARGSSCVYGQTHETNKVARRLYDLVAENSGFIVYERKV